MKLLTWLLAGVALFGTCHAAPPQQQAFGPIMFGDTQEVAEKHLREVAADLNRRHALAPTAADAFRDLLYKGTKFPPKMADKYKKVVAGVGLSSFPGVVTSVEVSTNIIAAAAFQTEAREDWEVFRDIGNAKFGSPIQAAPFPVALSDDPTVVSDLWKYGEIEIRLGVRHSPAGCTVFLQTALPGAPVR